MAAPAAEGSFLNGSLKGEASLLAFEAHKARKQAEEDAIKLQNRVRKLHLEKEKAEKLIEQTRKKADELAKIKARCARCNSTEAKKPGLQRMPRAGFYHHNAVRATFCVNQVVYIAFWHILPRCMCCGVRRAVVARPPATGLRIPYAERLPPRHGSPRRNDQQKREKDALRAERNRQTLMQKLENQRRRQQLDSAKAAASKSLHDTKRHIFSITREERKMNEDYVDYSRQQDLQQNIQRKNEIRSASLEKDAKIRQKMQTIEHMVRTSCATRYTATLPRTLNRSSASQPASWRHPRAPSAAAGPPPAPACAPGRCDVARLCTLFCWTAQAHPTAGFCRTAGSGGRCPAAVPRAEHEGGG